MKINSRPDEDEPTLIGSGGIILQVTPEQLELISALVYNCRLGQKTPYSDAAFDLIQALDAEYGSDFMEDAANNVDLQVTIEDDQSCVVFSTLSGNYYPTLEV